MRRIIPAITSGFGRRGAQRRSGFALIFPFAEQGSTECFGASASHGLPIGGAAGQDGARGRKRKQDARLRGSPNTGLRKAKPARPSPRGSRNFWAQAGRRLSGVEKKKERRMRGQTRRRQKESRKSEREQTEKKKPKIKARPSRSRPSQWADARGRFAPTDAAPKTDQGKPGARKVKKPKETALAKQGGDSRRGFFGQSREKGSGRKEKSEGKNAKAGQAGAAARRSRAAPSIIRGIFPIRIAAGLGQTLFAQGRHLRILGVLERFHGRQAHVQPRGCERLGFELGSGQPL